MNAQNTSSIKKNDLVKVISGKEKGKTGKVLKIVTKTNRAVVEKLNLVKRHTKPNQKEPHGGIVEKEATIHVSNLQLFCSKCSKSVRVVRKELDKGKKVRACAKCGEQFDK